MVLAEGVAARANRASEPLHSLIYFAPEADEQLIAAGLRPGRMCYFASRSAPMGAVGGGVTTATFYNFNPAVVARNIPRAWTLATPAEVIAARFRAADLALRRLLGPEVLASGELAEAAKLARAAAEGLEPAGRTLFAAHADLEWPDEPHLILWHAVTLLREFRGDGHIAVLMAGQLSGLEALVTHTATQRGFTEAAAKLLRRWSDEEWSAAVDALVARGLMDADGLTAAGRALRDRLEGETDRLAAAPWLQLGAEKTERFITLGKALCHTIAANGAFPAEMFAGPSRR